MNPGRVSPSRISASTAQPPQHLALMLSRSLGRSGRKAGGHFHSGREFLSPQLAG